MSVITNEMADVIRRNLPAVTAGALTERLEELEVKEAELIVADQLYADLVESSSETSKKLAAYEKREGRLAERETNLENIEESLRLLTQKSKENELQIKLNSAEANAEFARNVALGLVRNTEYRNHKLGSIPMIEKYGDGGQHTTAVHADITETKSAE